jgi:hypothetical protein
MSYFLFKKNKNLIRKKYIKWVQIQWPINGPTKLDPPVKEDFFLDTNVFIY